jgi:hypothetical protein
MPNPVPVTLASLTTPTSPTVALGQSLEICQQLGLPTTAWQPVQMIPDLIEVNAVIASGSSSLVALIAQGGYASLAAQMVDGNGNPITSWMALRATDQYGIVPGAASPASGAVPYTNTSGTAYPYSPNNPLRFQNPVTGATFATTGMGSLVIGGASSVVQVAADVAGTAGTTGTGVTLILLTPLIGVTIQAQGTTSGGTPTGSLVGSAPETNQQLLTRGQNKLATLAPIQSTDQPGPAVGDASGIFGYVATSIPPGPVSNPAPPYTVSSPITRVSRAPVLGNGFATVYIANADGAPPLQDVAVVQAAINALVVIDGTNITVQAANQVVVNVTAIVYIRASAGLSPTTVVANITSALATYFDQVPIGGYTTTSGNIVPLADIEDAVFDANGPGATVDLTLLQPNANVALGASGVPVSGTPTITVAYV